MIEKRYRAKVIPTRSGRRWLIEVECTYDAAPPWLPPGRERRRDRRHWFSDQTRRVWGSQEKACAVARQIVAEQDAKTAAERWQHDNTIVVEGEGV